MLQSVYRKITGTSMNCPRTGPHWEEIGFQGNDPKTDFRGVGMLGLLQMLHLLRAHESFVHRFHRFSQDTEHDFPMMCVSINITLQCLVALRTGALYPECNAQQNVLDAMNKVRKRCSIHRMTGRRSD